MEKSQLLCTFSSMVKLNSSISAIKSNHQVKNSKVYIYQVENEPMKLLLIYGIEKSENQEFLKDTIAVNRKQESNTIYTINSLNALIKDINGVEDRNYQVDWTKYQNTFIQVDKNESKGYKLNNIIFIKPWKL